jgi:Protein of unknown function (DUF1523)
MNYIISGIVGITIIALIIAAPLYHYGTDRDVTFTVNKTERVMSKDGNSSKYLIFTDKGVFENTDTFWYWKFNSSDIYGDMRNGNTYTAHVYGWRIQFLSMYPNVISANSN